MNLIKKADATRRWNMFAILESRLNWIDQSIYEQAYEKYI
jgi:hypothetical protein